jgi:hypothetical protein
MTTTDCNIIIGISAGLIGVLAFADQIGKIKILHIFNSLVFKIIIFILASIFFAWAGNKKDRLTETDNTSLNRKADSANSLLVNSKNDFRILQDTLNNVLNILEHNKISINFRSNKVIIESGFYTMHPDPELNLKLQAIKNNTHQSLTKQNISKKSKMDESVRLTGLKAAKEGLENSKKRYIKDSLGRDKDTEGMINKTQSIEYKQMSGYMKEDRIDIKNFTDSVKKYELK